MSLDVFLSADKRLRTDSYTSYSDVTSSFCLAEPTAKGVLITEFSNNGDVLNQIYKSGNDPISELRSFLGRKDLCIIERAEYVPVAVNAKCAECGKYEIKRHLDSIDPEKIVDVPVVPIFVCGNCGKRFYSLNDIFLKNIIMSNKELFDKNELQDMEKKGDAFVSDLKEYVIRTFASKKISRIKIE